MIYLENPLRGGRMTRNKYITQTLEEIAVLVTLSIPIHLLLIPPIFFALGFLSTYFSDQDHLHLSAEDIQSIIYKQVGKEFKQEIKNVLISKEYPLFSQEIERLLKRILNSSVNNWYANIDQEIKPDMNENEFSHLLLIEITSALNRLIKETKKESINIRFILIHTIISNFHSRIDTSHLEKNFNGREVDKRIISISKTIIKKIISKQELQSVILKEFVTKLCSFCILKPVLAILSSPNTINSLIIRILSTSKNSDTLNFTIKIKEAKNIPPMNKLYFSISIGSDIKVYSDKIFSSVTISLSPEEFNKTYIQIHANNKHGESLLLGKEKLFSFWKNTSTEWLNIKSEITSFDLLVSVEKIMESGIQYQPISTYNDLKFESIFENNTLYSQFFNYLQKNHSSFYLSMFMSILSFKQIRNLCPKMSKATSIKEAEEVQALLIERLPTSDATSTIYKEIERKIKAGNIEDSLFDEIFENLKQRLEKIFIEFSKEPSKLIDPSPGNQPSLIEFVLRVSNENYIASDPLFSVQISNPEISVLSIDRTYNDFIKLHHFLINNDKRLAKLSLLNDLLEKESQEQCKKLTSYIQILFSDNSAISSSFLVDFFDPESPFFSRQTAIDVPTPNKAVFELFIDRKAVLVSKPSSSAMESDLSLQHDSSDSCLITGDIPFDERQANILFRQFSSLAKLLLGVKKDGWVRGKMVSFSLNVFRKLYLDDINKELANSITRLFKDENLCNYVEIIENALYPDGIWIGDLEGREDIIDCQLEKSARYLLRDSISPFLKSLFGKDNCIFASDKTIEVLQDQEQNIETLCRVLEKYTASIAYDN
eukprot:GHVP01048281.1.p1 GENE.GHVP01048281.1~~GHVP01048281.1.p1  ORF type:complete len:826 (-),score=150.07 GHVP01048281.1:2206-4683(-)